MDPFCERADVDEVCEPGDVGGGGMATVNLGRNFGVCEVCFVVSVATDPPDDWSSTSANKPPPPP